MVHLTRRTTERVEVRHQQRHRHQLPLARFLVAVGEAATAIKQRNAAEDRLIFVEAASSGCAFHFGFRTFKA